MIGFCNLLMHIQKLPMYMQVASLMSLSVVMERASILTCVVIDSMIVLTARMKSVAVNLANGIRLYTVKRHLVFQYNDIVPTGVSVIMN